MVLGAYLHVCTCREHAHIVCVDGTQSKEVGSKRAAIHMQQRLAFVGKITPAEVPELLLQIKASPLFETDEELVKASLERNRFSLKNLFQHFFGRHDIHA